MYHSILAADGANVEFNTLVYVSALLLPRTVL